MDSILQDDPEHCYLCGRHEGSRYQAMHWHHIFGGNPNRDHSEKYGLKVRLGGYACHEYGEHAVHRDKEVDLKLKKEGQEAFERVHGSREDFRRIFGKSWL